MSEGLPSHSTHPGCPTDEHWMRRALDLAYLGLGRVEPNPMVGCVVVRDGREIGHGWHRQYGGPHAEVNALSGLRVEDVQHSDIFVTLEPCAHHGKTPPCLELLRQFKPKRVVVAMQDPYPEVSGRGIEGLRSDGIQVDVGILEEESRRLNAPYLKRLQTGLPWVIAKWAMTLDGAIATASGNSQWITSIAARETVHVLRSRMDAILVGSETVLRDNPLLTARLADGSEVPRLATRVVIDRRLRTPIDSQIVKTAALIPLVIVTSSKGLQHDLQKANRLRELGAELLILPADDDQASLGWLLRELCRRGATNVMVEGGGKLLGSLFDGKWIDQVDCYIAPRILGSEQAARPISGKVRQWMSQSQQLDQVTLEMCGADIHVRGLLTSDPKRDPDLLDTSPLTPSPRG